MKTTFIQITTRTFIVLLLVVGNVKAMETKIQASNQKNIESTLQLENWMTDETFWNTNSVNIAEYVQETEIDLVLESWMVNYELWIFNNDFFEEAETELVLEKWILEIINYEQG